MRIYSRAITLNNSTVFDGKENALNIMRLVAYPEDGEISIEVKNENGETIFALDTDTESLKDLIDHLANKGLE